MNLAEQLEQNEKYDEAYAEYKKQLAHKQGDVELLTKLAHLALILEKKDDAKIYYAKILEADPSNIFQSFPPCPACRNPKPVRCALVLWLKLSVEEGSSFLWSVTSVGSAIAPGVL